MIALPLIALLVLAVAGLGPATILARRLSSSAQVALAAPLSAAVLACGSALVYLDVPTELVCAVILVALGTCTIVVAKRVPRTLASYGWPLAVALAAVALASIPFLGEGDWGVATFSNADPYVWVSQATSLLEGSPEGQAAVHPDRIAFARITDEQWPTGLPFTLAGLAWLSGSDPADVYGAFAALLAGLLALAAFFCAHGVLLWRRTLAAVAAGLVGANGYLLFGTFFGWQAQIALATFGLLSVFCFRIALEVRALRREQLLAGLFAAAGIATYGWTYVSFAGLIAATLGGYLFAHGLSSWRRAGSVLGGFCVAVAVAGGLPLIQLLRAFSGASTDWIPELAQTWSRYDPALPSDSLGLVPRTEALLQTRPNLALTAVAAVLVIAVVAIAGGFLRTTALRTPRGVLTVTCLVLLALFASIRARYLAPSEWAFLGLLVAVAVIALGLASTRSFRNPRGDVLAACTVFLVVQVTAFHLFDLTPLYSIRLMGYAVPIFILLALSPFASRRSPAQPRAITAARALPFAAAAAMFCVTSVAAAEQGGSALRTTDDVDRVATAARAAEPRGLIEIDVAEPWLQVWLVYYLRDRDVVLPEPTLYFTGFTTKQSRDLGNGPQGSPVYRIAPRLGAYPRDARYLELQRIGSRAPASSVPAETEPVRVADNPSRSGDTT